MASSRTCRACQRRLLDAFPTLSTSSPNIGQWMLSRPNLEFRGVSHIQARRLIHSTTFRRAAEQQYPQNDSSASGFQNSPSTIPEASTSSPILSSKTDPQSSPDASIPWYLRVEPPTPPAVSTSPHLATQEIPPLPMNSPEILLPILQHLSISIGLDNLSLLDLRDLSPPSALGANLLMIIGTARSHKHLNTSADRFCRWLRSTYKLRPYADGLLGRNELKLKLRRRNRRLKLAQSVGNTTALGGDDGGYDSGITTGWICCNLGAVGNVTVPTGAQDVVVADAVGVNEAAQTEAPRDILSEKDQERILEDEEDEYENEEVDDFKYSGFGSVNYAPRIVVQMFTEEKRLEMDLEGLWETRLTRRDVKEQKGDEEFADSVFETGRIEEELAGKSPAAKEGLREFKPVHG